MYIFKIDEKKNVQNYDLSKYAKVIIFILLRNQIYLIIFWNTLSIKYEMSTETINLIIPNSISIFFPIIFIKFQIINV